MYPPNIANISKNIKSALLILIIKHDNERKIKPKTVQKVILFLNPLQ